VHRNGTQTWFMSQVDTLTLTLSPQPQL
jgi:hypothetical protein